MGWFWADAPVVAAVQTPKGHAPVTPGREPPPGCPMHQKSADALTPSSKPVAPPSTSGGCPVPHDQRTAPAAATSGGCPVPHASKGKEPKSMLSQLNPLNYMFPDLSQERAKDQKYELPTSREPSTIPKGSGDGNWEYPSPQQMYNALLRKGYEDTDITAVESMVSVHNFLNEGAWQEILGWENRFARGLYKGWQLCKRGEAHFQEELDRHWDGRDLEPSLVRFQGRPKEMTPKATMLQVLGWLYPSKFGTEPPFDRHDWYVAREQDGQRKEVRYIIDYYAGEDDPNGEPVFFLDVRPAATLQGSAERIIRWTSDVWWRAIGGDERERNPKSIWSMSLAKRD